MTFQLQVHSQCKQLKTACISRREENIAGFVEASTKAPFVDQAAQISSSQYSYSLGTKTDPN